MHQRNSKVYIYAYTPASGLVCIIYTSYVLCSPEERFNSTNNKSISSDHYRRTKFSAKMTVHQCSPQYLYPTNPSASIEKQTCCFVLSPLPFAVKAEI